MITARIEGHVVGDTWGSGRCSMPKNFTVSRVHRKGRKLRDMVKNLLSHCGDFQGEVKLTADTRLVVESMRTWGTKRGYAQTLHLRVIEVTELPSLADLVDLNTYVED